MSQEVITPSSLGLSRQAFAAMLEHYRQTTNSDSSDKKLLLSDRDVNKLALVFNTFQDDPDLCGLLAELISYINTHFEKHQAKVKKYQRSTIGMF